MNSIFSIDGKLFQFLDTVSNLIILNLLWLLCSIPIVTIGASTTALYSVTMKLVRKEDPYIVKSFFHSFRLNFKPAGMIWGLMLVMGFFLYTDSYVFTHYLTGMMRYTLIPVTICGFLFFATACYLFPMLSCFENSIRGLLSNSFRMAMGNIGYTLLLMLTTFFPVFTLYLLSENIILALFLCAVIMFSLTAYIKSFFLYKTFRVYLPDYAMADM